MRRGGVLCVVIYNVRSVLLNLLGRGPRATGQNLGTSLRSAAQLIKICCINHIMSTTPRRGETMPIIFASKSKTEPPLVMTRSPISALTPSRLSRLTEAKARASDLEMAPLASIAACIRVNRQGLSKYEDIEEEVCTQARSNLAFLALQASVIPIPTVTFAAKRADMEFSLDRGRPGRLSKDQATVISKKRNQTMKDSLPPRLP